MNNNFKGKTAVISGVGSRSGKATAYLLAQLEAKLVLVARNKELINKVAKEINKNGGIADTYVCNTTIGADVSKTINKIIKKNKSIDILINNVGGSYTKKLKLAEMSEEEWDDIITNNIKSTFLMSKNVIPHMIRQKKGKIINVSAAIKTLIDGNTAYGTAKMGIIGLTKNLAYEYAENNIRVNCICPGVIRENSKKYNSNDLNISLMKKGESEDIAHAMKFFASDESAWITGQTIVIDGGESIFIDVNN